MWIYDQLSTKTWIIIIVVIVVIIIMICFFVIYNSNRSTPYHEKRYKLIRYGGLFRQVSGMNIGHPKEAPIFHARPWLGRDLHRGLGEYIGSIRLPTDKKMTLIFPESDFAYEVNIIKYPQWECIPEEGALYKPKNLSIGYHNTDIIIEEGTEFILMVTGIPGNSTNTEDVDTWLSKCDVLVRDIGRDDYSNNSVPAIYKKNKPPVQEDASFAIPVEAFYNNYSDIWLGMNPEYDITHNIVSSPTDTSFPLTSGIVSSITYTPQSIDETIFIIYPNRKHTLNTESAIYVEIDGKRAYLNQNNDAIAAGVFSYDVNTLDTIYVEERILTSPEGNILPFYMYIARPSD